MAVNFNFMGRTYPCPVELTLDTLQGKWKVLILWNLRQSTLRYSELKNKLPKISHKMFSQKLKELEADGLIHRKMYPVIPPKTEYSLTEEGLSLMPILQAMQKWGVRFKENPTT